MILVGLLVLGLLRLTSSQIAANSLRRQVQEISSPQRRRVVTELLREGGNLNGSEVSVFRITDSGATAVAGDLRVSFGEAELTALRGGRIVEGRLERDGSEWVFVARPAGRERDGMNVLVLAREARLSPELLRAIGGRFALAALLAMTAAGLIGWLLASRISRPLRNLAGAARNLAKGDFATRVAVEGADEIGTVAASFNSMAEDLGDADRRQRDFLLSVSHELRTPLTAIQGYAEALEDGTASGDRRDQAAHVIVSESRRLARLVSDLLDLARLDARRFQVSIEEVDVEAVLRSTERAFSKKAQEAGVVLDVNSGGGIVLADYDRLMQVLGNLLDNALRYTPSGGSIHLSSDPTGDFAGIKVADAGPGFEPEDLARAFERQYLWTKYRGTRDAGTGLGLVITKEIVETMGGTLSANNR